MAEEAKFTAAYVPFKTFEHGLDLLAGLGAIPPKIDHTVFPSVNGVMRGQIISAFKFLGLVQEDGTPTAQLGKLALDKANRKIVLKSIIESQYPDITSADLASMSPSQLDARLGNTRYNVSGATKQKARSFLLKAAEYADIPLSKLLTTKSARASRGSRSSRKKPTNSNGGKSSANGSAERTGDGFQQLPRDPESIRMPIALAPGRTAYVELPKDWTPKDAEKLLALLRLSLDIGEN